MQVNRPALAARNIVDQEPEHPLPLPHRRPRIMPHARQIARECLNAGTVLAPGLLGVGRRGSTVLRVGLRQTQQRLIPLALETVRHQAVVDARAETAAGLLFGAVRARARRVTVGARPFDQRDFFLVGTDAWADSMLPFEPTSAVTSGSPGYTQDPGAVAEPEEPDIVAGMPVYDKDGQRVGDVEAVELDGTSRRIVRITLRRGFLFAHETSIPASLVESITDRIVLRTGTEAVRRLGRSPS